MSHGIQQEDSPASPESDASGVGRRKQKPLSALAKLLSDPGFLRKAEVSRGSTYQRNGSTQQASDFEALVKRSEALYERLFAGWTACHDTSARSCAVSAACRKTLAFGHILQTRIATDPLVALAVLEWQLAAVVAATWALHCADVRIANEVLRSDLNDLQTNGLPSTSEMAEQLRADHLSASTFAGFQHMLQHATNLASADGTNTFDRRNSIPYALGFNVLRTSNGLNVIAADTMALLSGDSCAIYHMTQLRSAFKDCLVHASPGRVPKA